eukprot:GILI01013897.1.p1 GENE.GILI01013897.1~~GILI01013897.1.p1  ORF type:complete len:377 (+),score=88.02 GILI01013897.1:82-1131(+)
MQKAATTAVKRTGLAISSSVIVIAQKALGSSSSASSSSSSASPSPSSSSSSQSSPPCNYEILLLKRAASLKFAGGAFVFPGGVVDEADKSSEWSDVIGSSEERNDALKELKITTVRETFEESGLLLAQPSSPASVIPSVAEKEEWRKKFKAESAPFIQLFRQNNLRPHLSGLDFFVRFVTPSFESRRYDTTFFTYLLPAEQRNHVAIDNGEMVEFAWMTPSEALRKFSAKEIFLGPPQWYILNQLSRYPTVENLRTGFKPIQAPFLPVPIHKMQREGSSVQLTGLDVDKARDDKEKKPAVVMALPGDAEHPNHPGPAGARHRLTLHGPFNYLLEKDEHVTVLPSPASKL